MHSSVRGLAFTAGYVLCSDVPRVNGGQEIPLAAALSSAQRLCLAVLCFLFAAASVNAQSPHSDVQPPPPAAAAATTDAQAPGAPSAADQAGTGQNRITCQS